MITWVFHNCQGAVKKLTGNNLCLYAEVWIFIPQRDLIGRFQIWWKKEISCWQMTISNLSLLPSININQSNFSTKTIKTTNSPGIPKRRRQTTSTTLFSKPKSIANRPQTNTSWAKKMNVFPSEKWCHQLCTALRNQ